MLWVLSYNYKGSNTYEFEGGTVRLIEFSSERQRRNFELLDFGFRIEIRSLEFEKFEIRNRAIRNLS